MPGGEVLRAAAASSLGHEDDNHEKPVESKESEDTAAARAGAATERAHKQGKEAHWVARMRGLGLVLTNILIT